MLSPDAAAVIPTLAIKLIPWFADAVTQLVDEAIGEGIVEAVDLTSGHRDSRTQRRLFANWRKAVARFGEAGALERGHLPAAEPGTSYHEVGLAVDVAVAPSDALENFGLFAESRGFRWGGRFGDPVHLDAGNQVSLEEARAGFNARQLMEV